uniref:Uncharacterized protein n=1 Tax=Cajanus cajan TaxID=3821 RepID=A0A151TNS5_CAJCA|nr:hypothetical protein KK1_022309 [Cajanus cajan]
MESQNTNQEKEGVVGRVLALPKVVKEKVLGISRLTKEIAKDDPRKVIHSIKVGLSISMVSLFYYYQPLYENFGLSAMWAVITVVVVFDYTVEKIADLVNDLATITHFHIDDTSKSPKPKSSQSPHYDCAESGNKTNNLQLIILVEESTLAVSESEKSIIV